MPRTVPLNLLDRVRIASPCTARWEDMTGDDKVRHCAECNLKVHNFSAMSREEAEGLLARHFDDEGGSINGRVCAGWYRRADGMAIFADCPVGWAKVRRRARLALVRVAALCGVTSLAAVVAARSGSVPGPFGERASAGGMAPFASIARWLAPAAATGPFKGKMAIMPGRVMVTPRPAITSSNAPASNP